MNYKKDALDKWMDEHLVIIGMPKKDAKKLKKNLKKDLINSEGSK